MTFTDTTTALTSVSKSILRRLDECIVDYSNNVLTLTEFTLKCDSLKLSCLDRLSSYQLLYVGAVVATAKASAMYWDANADSWDDVILPNTSAISKRDRSILRADVLSAIGGAITGAPGGPLGALGGAWFGGCIGSCLEGIAIGFGWE